MMQDRPTDESVGTAHAESPKGVAGVRAKIGRYRIDRLFKRRQHVETLLGTDPSDGSQVVIKAAMNGSISAGARMRLEHESAALKKIQNSSDIRSVELGQDGDLLYLVTPFVSGETLTARLKRGPLSLAETLTVARSIVSSLQAAHAQRILHQNIKPENIVVNDQGAISTASLIDFLFLRSSQVINSIREQPAESAKYISPEQAGLLDVNVCESSDLYSAGVVLFECLSGVAPFEGKNAGDVLRQHMTVQPQLNKSGVKVPRALDELIQRLLRKDPRDRYQSAAGVAADLQIIAESLDNGIDEPDLVIGQHDPRHTLTEPAFVGRDRELDVLNSQLDRTKSGQGGLVLLEAESGGGKTRLVAEFAQRAAQQGAWILRGQGLDQAAQRPFQVLTGVVDDLVATAGTEPDVVKNICAGMSDYKEAACSAVPQLAGLFGSTPASELGPETFGEARNIQALTALLDLLGSTGRLVLVLLDDCQWADQFTLRVLSNLQRVTDFQERLMLVVAAFRSEEVPPNHALRALNHVAHLDLPAFEASHVRKLVESMAGPLPDEAVAVIEQLAEGSPFMAAAAVRGLVETGALVPVPDADLKKERLQSGWRVEPLAMTDVQSSRHAAAFLARRVELLPDTTLKLLTVGAVLGKEFDLFTASKLAQQTPGEAIAALREAQHRHIVWTKAANDRCTFIHDKLRETLLDRLNQEERKDLHLHAAVDLEDEASDRVYELAYHFDAAGESLRALPFALASAEDARTHRALELAEEYYRIAQRGVPDADEATRYRIAEGLGDVLMLRGRYQPAAQMFEAANYLAKNDFTRAQIEGKIGVLAFKTGDNEAGIEATERSLRSLGRKIPSSKLGFLRFLVWELFVQTLHTMFPKVFLARRSLEGTENEMLAIDLHIHLARAYFFERGKVPSLWTQLRGVNLAERYPPTRELRLAWASHAPVMSVLPWISRGEAYGKKAVEIAKTLNDVGGQGQSLNYLGVVLFVGAKYDDCISSCREAVQLLERTGDFWERNNAWYSTANALYRKGELALANSEARQLYEACREMKDHKHLGFSLEIWSRTSGGELPADIVQLEMQRQENDVQTKAQILLAEAVRLVGQNELTSAEKVLIQARDMCRDIGMNAWVAPVLPWLATVRRLQARGSTDVIPHRRRQLLSSARRAARRAVSVARKFQTDLPHALREVGLIAAMHGSIRRARQHFDESLAVAERQGARFEYAQTLLARGRIGLEVDWPGAEVDVSNAREALHSLGADFALGDAEVPEPESAEATTLSLVDRFDTVLDAGRRIASQLSRKAILTEVREAAQRLLRGERCLLLKLDDDDADDLAAVSGDIEAEYIRSMVDRALATGQVIVFTESQAEDEKALLAGIRSALCAPVFVRKKSAGCFYVDHRNVGDLFGADEQRISEFIATIAGAALENAHGFTKLQQLAATLEERVQERTAFIESQNDKLEAQRIELQRSNDELQQFAYIASHDLQEPLRTVASYCQLISKRYKGKLDEKADEFIGYAVDGATKMKTLITDLLTYSRVGKQSKPFEATNCNDLLRELLRSLRTMINHHEASVTFDELPTVMADKTQLMQLFQNLISNGIKFKGKAQPKVHISVNDGGGYWTFAIKDNGIGIDPQYHNRIFNVFERLQNRQEYSGTGIGLAVCKKTVELHGGKIWVESQPEKGSTFFFTIPRSPSSGSAEN